MVLLDKIWDYVSGGSAPEGLGRLRKITTKAPTTDIKDKEKLEGSSGMYQMSLSMSATPGTPTTSGTPSTPSSATARKENVWSVFYPGNKLDIKTIGADKLESKTLTSYDWCYCGAWE